MIKKSFFLLLLISHFIYSQAPPILISEGNELHCKDPEGQNIVTLFTITDLDSDSIEGLSIQISEGYVEGEDSLYLFNEAAHPNIQVETFDTVTGKLELKGPGGGVASYENLKDAVYDIRFLSSNLNPVTKTFSITIGEANYLPSTGHFYEFIDQEGITWEEAREDAEDLYYYDLQGYLVTITSEAENQISAVQTNNVGWIGASDAFTTEGDWRWVTGPEGDYDSGLGLPFWNGTWTSGTPT